MSVPKVGFNGFRSQDLVGLRSAFEEGLGMAPTEASDDQTRYRLENGARLEIYSEWDEFRGFFTTGPVVGFTVEDFDGTWALLQGMGIEALTDVQEEDGQRWFHFRLPDDTLAELIGGSRAVAG